MKSVAVAAVCAALAHGVFAVSLAAQTPSDSACAAVLAAPSRDSVKLMATLQIHAFDREHDLSPDYQRSFADGVREFLSLPVPLAMDAYETTPDTTPGRRFAYLAVRGGYRVTVTRDGRVRGIRILGGARNTAFDRAMVAAMTALDTSHLLPPVTTLDGAKGDVDAYVEIATRERDNPHRTPWMSQIMVTAGAIPGNGFKRTTLVPDTSSGEPLFVFRSPLRRVTQPRKQISGVGPLRYPENLYRDRVDGAVVAAYVIGADSLAEAGSIQILGANRLEFAQSVLDAIPKFRFQSLVLEGCAVREIVEQPFSFSIVR